MPLARIARVNWARSSASDALNAASNPNGLALPVSRFRHCLLQPQPRFVVGEIETQRGH